MKTVARMLRRQSTDTERLLWKHLRARHMAGFKFRRQVLIEPYIVDFACLEAKLIVEADGGQHAQQVDYDRERSAFLETLGYTVMRFWDHEILVNTDAVLEQIHRFLMDIPSPPPSP